MMHGPMVDLLKAEYERYHGTAPPPPEVLVWEPFVGPFLRSLVTIAPEPPPPGPLRTAHRHDRTPRYADAPAPACTACDQDTAHTEAVHWRSVACARLPWGNGTGEDVA